jgi:alcohol dehydrogenase
MKALVYSDKSIELSEVEKPTIKKPSDAIVRIMKTTICGTDLHILRGNVSSVSSGRTLGHEGIGIVEVVGRDCHRVSEGDLVLISTVSACGQCSFCRKALFGQCSDGGWILGNTINGCQAEFVRIPHANNSLFKLPSHLTDRKLNSLVMFSDIMPTAYEIGVKDGLVAPGKTLAIVGVGPVGLSAIITAKLLSPSKIIAIDIDDNRLEKALEFGADIAINNKNNTAVDEVMALTNGEGIDVAIEAIGSPLGWYICEDIVTAGGNIAILGVHGAPATLHLERMWNKNFTLTAGLVHAYSTPMLLDMVLNNKLDVSNLISHEMDLFNIDKAYDDFLNAAQTKSLKIILNNK